MVAIIILWKLKWNEDSPWAAALFYQPKNTKDLQIVMDFCKMNKAIERHLFLLPWILEMLQKLEKFKSATELDLFQEFYTIPLD